MIIAIRQDSQVRNSNLKYDFRMLLIRRFRVIADVCLETVTCPTALLNDVRCSDSETIKIILIFKFILILIKLPDEIIECSIFDSRYVETIMSYAWYTPGDTLIYLFYNQLQKSYTFLTGIHVFRTNDKKKKKNCRIINYATWDDSTRAVNNLELFFKFFFFLTRNNIICREKQYFLHHYLMG